MSSPSSPPLIIDVSDRPAERRLVWAACVIAAALPAGVLPWPSWQLVSLVFVAFLLAAFRAHGWLGGARRVVRVAWRADGQWHIEQADGRSAQCELCLSSRVAGRVVWLQLRTKSGPRRRISLILTRGRSTDDDLRRLIVRLRLDVPRSGTLVPQGG